MLGASLKLRGLTSLDLQAGRLRGHGVPIAVVFTRLGYWPALTCFGIIAIAASFAAGDRAWLLAGLVVSHALSQGALAWVKLLYRRTRPEYWLVNQEADTSFPSGHSATAMTFYLALALLAWHLPMPVGARVGATIVLAPCVALIPWSRLALGAHFLTDVAGGVLFGSAWLAASIALASALPLVR